VSFDLLHPDVLLIAFAAVLGAIIGSFLNVCILRWGAEPKESIIRPPSHCPRCGKGLAWYENIPVLSWLLLRARCRGCGEPISMMYPLIELATAAIWAYMAWRHDLTIEAIRGAVFGTILLGIAMTDARAYIIPHEFSIGGTAVLVLMAGWPDLAGVWAAVQGALVGAGLVLIIGELSQVLIGQEAMGGGDCALMGLVGSYFGWEAVLPVLILGAGISLVLHLIATARPGPAAPSTEPNEAPGFRWAMVARLLGGGAVLMAGMVVAIRAGILGQALHAMFHGLLAAGVIYYASFLLPQRALHWRWLRVAGLVGTSLGIAFGGGFAPPRIVTGLLLGLGILWYSNRIEPVETPVTSEGLSAEGYIPFGVGLAIAAGLLAFSGIYPVVESFLADYGRLVGTT
jgi:leader peptidase (prepilin peptidase)/N-methyltransferase